MRHSGRRKLLPALDSHQNNFTTPLERATLSPIAKVPTRYARIYIYSDILTRRSLGRRGAVSPDILSIQPRTSVVYLGDLLPKHRPLALPQSLTPVYHLYI